MGLLGKLFGGSKKQASEPEQYIEDTLNTLLDKGQFDLSFEIDPQEGTKHPTFDINFFGDDEGLLTKKDALLLDSVQLFLKRSLQHNFAETIVNVRCDANGYREEESRQLESMIEKLKNKALDQGKSVYVKALSPKERRIVHQFIAQDERLKSKSIGDGHYKKIKIFPIEAAK